MTTPDAFVRPARQLHAADDTAKEGQIGIPAQNVAAGGPPPVADEAGSVEPAAEQVQLMKNEALQEALQGRPYISNR